MTASTNQILSPDNPGVRETLSNSLYDEDDPNSVINKLPDGSFKAAMIRLKDQFGHKFYDTDKKLIRFCEPNEWDMRLRLAFWDEFYLCQKTGTVMNLERACRGVIDKSYISEVMADPKKMLFILTHPESYTSSLRLIHRRTLERMKDIAELPIVNKKGEPIPSVINAIIKVCEMADVRLKGAVPQRMQIESRSMNVNVGNPLDLSKMSLEQLEALEKKMVKRAKELSAPKNDETVIEGEVVGDTE